MLRDETRAPEAKALYLELLALIRPSATALDKITIQRSDEARKLKNLKVLLKHIKWRTRENPFSDSEGPEDDLRIISMEIDDLGEYLKSLVRIAPRLNEYTVQIEPKFAHGPFTIINKYGYRKEEYADILQTLDKAADSISVAGFSNILYGDVWLEAIKSSGWSGRYQVGPDIVELNIDSRYRFSEVYTLVHEFGHRYWYKVMTEDQRDAYMAAYAGTTTSVTVEERKAMWDALEKNNWDTQSARRALPNHLKELFTEAWKDFRRFHLNPTPENIVKNQASMQRSFIRPNLKYLLLDSKRPNSVTDYGRTNVVEDFAEVFAHYCMRMSMSEDAMNRFQGAIGKVAA